MQITTANYLTATKRVDFTKLPKDISDMHETLLEGAEVARDGSSKWNSFSQSPDVQDFLNDYLPVLNRLAKKPANLAKNRAYGKSRALTSAKSSQSGVRMGAARTQTRKAASTAVAVTRQSEPVVNTAKNRKYGTASVVRRAVAGVKTSGSGVRMGAKRTETRRSKVGAAAREEEQPKHNVGTTRKVPASYKAAGTTTKAKSAKTSSKATTLAKKAVPAQKTYPSGKRADSVSLVEARAKRAQLLAERIGIAEAEAFANMSRSQVIALGLRLNHKRYEGLIDTDSPSTNKRRLEATAENLLKWVRQPGRYDLVGVDSAGLTDVTVFKKRDADVSKQQLESPKKASKASNRTALTTKKATTKTGAKKGTKATAKRK